MSITINSLSYPCLLLRAVVVHLLEAVLQLLGALHLLVHELHQHLGQRLSLLVHHAALKVDLGRRGRKQCESGFSERCSVNLFSIFEPIQLNEALKVKTK